MKEKLPLSLFKYQITIKQKIKDYQQRIYELEDYQEKFPDCAETYFRNDQEIILLQEFILFLNQF